MIILSCGHEVDDFKESYCVTVKSFDKQNNRALAYKTVCHSCFKEHEYNGELFYDDNIALNWLLGR
jgi:hypothetical protein